MTADTMLTWSGTRHKIGDRRENRWGIRPSDQTILYNAACASAILLQPEHQERIKYRKDCKRCFPAVVSVPDFEAQRDSARGIAQELEAENARLIELVRQVAGLGCNYQHSTCPDARRHPNLWCISCRAVVLLAPVDET